MNPEREIKKLLQEFISLKDNVYTSNRIFVAVSVLNWVYTKYTDKMMLQYYLEEVKKHLRGEITLYWEDGVVKIHRGRK